MRPPSVRHQVNGLAGVPREHDLLVARCPDEIRHLHRQELLPLAAPLRVVIHEESMAFYPSICYWVGPSVVSLASISGVTGVCQWGHSCKFSRFSLTNPEGGERYCRSFMK